MPAVNIVRATCYYRSRIETRGRNVDVPVFLDPNCSFLSFALISISTRFVADGRRNHLCTWTIRFLFSFFLSFVFFPPPSLEERGFDLILKWNCRSMQIKFVEFLWESCLPLFHAVPRSLFVFFSFSFFFFFKFRGR